MKIEKLRKENKKNDFKLTCGYCEHFEQHYGFRCKKHNFLMVSNEICGQFQHRKELENTISNS